MKKKILKKLAWAYVSIATFIDATLILSAIALLIVMATTAILWAISKFPIIGILLLGLVFLFVVPLKLGQWLKKEEGLR